MGRKKAIILVLSICVLALIVWGALIIFVFGDRDGDGAGDTEDKGPKDTVVWCLSEMYLVSSSGEKTLLRKYEYDQKGRCVSEKAGAEDSTKTMEYVYDEKNLFLTKITCDDLNRYEISYDNKGRVRREVIMSLKEDSVRTVEYDEYENRTYRCVRNGEKNEEERWLYTYDEYGHVIKEIYQDNGGKQEVIQWSDCDDTGRVLRTYEKNKRGNPDDILLSVVYNTDGSRAETKYPGKELSGDTVYNADGKMTEEITRTTNGSEEVIEVRYTYKYDEKGRLIKSICVNDYTKRQTEMEYTYMTEGNQYIVWEHDVIIDLETDQIIEFDQKYSAYTLREGTAFEDGTYDKYEYRMERTDGRGEKTGNERSVTEFAYDENGNLISQTMFADEIYDSSNKTEFGRKLTTHYVYIPIYVTAKQAERNREFFDPLKR